MEPVWAVNCDPCGSGGERWAGGGVGRAAPEALGYPVEVAQAPKADHTACPHCGHSPISESDERCPSCYNWVRELPRFHAARVEIHNDAELERGDASQGTRIGGLDRVTNSVEANPGASAALLICLGLGLGCAGMGFVPASGSPQAYLGVGAFDVICAILLIAFPAIVRPVVVLASPLQLVLLLYVGRAELRSPETVSLALVPLAVLVGTRGEPGPKFRSLAFSVGVGLLVYSGVVRISARMMGFGGAFIDAPQAGFRAQLPAGFVQLGGPDDLGGYLSLGGLDPQMTLFTFGDPARRLGGLWGLAPAGRYLPSRLAQGFAESLNASSPSAKPVAAEVGIRLPSSTFERGLGAGRTASVTALKLPDDRIAVLVVAGSTSDVERSRAQIARGASFAPAARP